MWKGDQGDAHLCMVHQQAEHDAGCAEDGASSDPLRSCTHGLSRAAMLLCCTS